MKWNELFGRCRTSLRESFMALAVLLAFTLVVFGPHLFAGAVFPWDFTLSYHAVVYYWMEAVKSGVWPAWVSNQAVGYPIALNLQSGLFYPPYYFFVLVDIPFTLRAAVVFQVVHVFLSGFGAYLLFRALNFPWLVALIGGVAYFLFGGMYSNASHPDIVRAFCLLPWLILSATLLLNPARRRSGIILLPLFIVMIWTGGYPGATIAMYFVGGGLTVLLLVFRKLPIRDFAILWVMVALGTGMAAIAFLPAFLLKGEIGRATDAVVLAKTFLDPAVYGSIFYKINASGFVGDITMRSMSLVVVPVVFILFVKLEDLKNNLAVVVMALLVMLFAGGGLFYELLTAFASPLGLSRFPSSDYRGCVAIIIIYFSLVGMVRYLNADDRTKRDRLIAFLLLPILAYLWVDPKIEKLHYLVTCLLGFGVIAYILYQFDFKARATALALCILCVIQLADFERVHGGEGYWRSDGYLPVHEQMFGSLQQVNPELALSFAGRPTRPKRDAEHLNHEQGYAGYLTGNYMVSDYAGPMKFARQLYIASRDDLVRFAALPWVAVSSVGVLSADRVNANLLHAGTKSSDQRVKILRYENTRIQYSVTSSQNFWFVENESYFPGWTAQTSNGERLIPKDYFGFRVWELPAGSYKMTAHYETPYFDKGLRIAGGALIAWLLTIVYAIFFVRRTELL
ncbi:hypothetical protein ACTSKR_02695 [Chitinibacteraceae bacterium HSL-7]